MKQEPLAGTAQSALFLRWEGPNTGHRPFPPPPRGEGGGTGRKWRGEVHLLSLPQWVLPAQGEILYRGTAITKKNRNALRKNVGIVFQDPDQQIIASTVAGEVSFGPMNLRLPLAEVRRGWKRLLPI